MSPPPPDPGGRTLIAGCGDLGSRIARRLIDTGREVCSLTRSGAGTGDIRALRGDVADVHSLPALDAAFPLIVYCIAPSSRDEHAYRRVFVDGLRNVLGWAATAATRLVFVSSTAVYGRNEGGWVDESTPCAPDSFNGRVLLEAEAIVRARAGYLVLRPGGIYGPGRDLLIRNLRARVEVTDGMRQCGNRIHVDDAARATCHLIEQGERGVFNLVDRFPAPAIEVMDWLAERMRVPPLVRDLALTEPGGRRIDAGKLARSGFAWTHPDFRSGYAELLAAV